MPFADDQAIEWNQSTGKQVLQRIFDDVEGVHPITVVDVIIVEHISNFDYLGYRCDSGVFSLNLQLWSLL